MLNQKYVVRPVISYVPDDGQATEGKAFPQGDYFVLLKKDLLAAQALWSYVGVLHVACDVLPDSPEKAKLAILADDIADLAGQWDQFLSKKLPD